MGIGNVFYLMSRVYLQNLFKILDPGILWDKKMDKNDIIIMNKITASIDLNYW